uniref:Uncharacterized protein n=1 Tax=Cannabis sativa TaxID=3483 RepID=A0A803NJQ8_CANSA
MYGFNGAGIPPCGKIKLPLIVFTASKQTTIMATFIVVDVKSLYNVMLRLPTLYDPPAISLVCHFSVRFAITVFIGCLLGNQGTARECYNASLSITKKTSSTATTLKGTKKTSFDVITPEGMSKDSPRKARETTKTSRDQTVKKV